MIPLLNNIKSHLDSQVLYYLLYKPNSFNKTVVLLHGMEDDKSRYHEFAMRLYHEHIQVYVLDLRGHGNSVNDDRYGYFANQDGWLYQLRDTKQLIDTIDSEVILMGHSMGSLFARSYLKRYPHSISKVIISGTPAYQAITKIAKSFLKSPFLSIKQKQKPNHFLQKILIQGFNKDILNPKTDFDWLSFDEKNVESYIQNPKCGFSFTTQGFLDLFELLEDSNQIKSQSIIDNVDVMFISGKQDPCGLMNKKGVEKAAQVVKSWGYQPVLKYYENSRHEILFDNDKEQVIKDILEFIK